MRNGNHHKTAIAKIILRVKSFINNPLGVIKLFDF